MSLATEMGRYDALALADLIARKEITPLELLECVIQRIDSVRQLKCICHPAYEAARKRAQQALPQGPLSGLPLFLKDLILLHEGTPMTSGSAYMQGHIAAQSSEVVRKLLAAGMIFTARTTSAEFGSLPTVESTHFGTTRNPWNAEYTTGGSSGGAAALVAARIFPLVDANDGGGSVRAPAALCGVVGLKPSRGRHSFAPSGDWRFGMAVCGCMSLSVRDAAAYLDVVSGNMPGDMHSLPLPPQSFLSSLSRTTPLLRIGLLRDKDDLHKDHPACRAAVEDIAACCASLGHELVDFEMAHDLTQARAHFQRTGDVWVAFRLTEAARVLGRPPREDELEASIWDAYQRGKTVDAITHETNLEAMRRYAFALAECFARYDVILTPSTAQPGVKLGCLNPTRQQLETAQQSPTIKVAPNLRISKYLTMLNITGQPGITLPVALSNEGLPIGVQLVGRVGGEATILQLARDIEAARPWFDRLPPICAC